MKIFIFFDIKLMYAAASVSQQIILIYKDRKKEEKSQYAVSSHIFREKKTKYLDTSNINDKNL